MDQTVHYTLAPGHRMQWEPVQDSWVILYPEGMVNLNESAAETLKRCDGSISLAEVIIELEKLYSTDDLAEDIEELITSSLEQGWLIKS